MSEATIYAWKKKYAHVSVSELSRLRQLEEENGAETDGRGSQRYKQKVWK